MEVQRLSVVIPMTDEMMIDMGIASPEQIERQRVREAEREARWRSLPWHVRLMRRHIRPRWNDWRERIAHANRALRGIECEWDE